MNFPKPSNHELRSNPVELARVCANRHVEMCESDKIFMTSIRGVIVWVWEKMREKIWELEGCGVGLVRST